MATVMTMTDTGTATSRTRVVLYRNGSVRTLLWAEGLGWRCAGTYPRWWGRLFHRKELAALRAS